jgi:hypothetical protein
MRARATGPAVLAVLGAALVLGSAAAPAAGSSASAGSIDGVRVLRADAGGVSFEVAVPQPYLAPAGDPSEGLAGLEILGFEPTGIAGAPAIPERVVWIGIPEGATVEVEGVGLDPVELGPVRLAPRLRRDAIDSEELARTQDGTLRRPGPGRLEPYLRQPEYATGGGEHAVAELAAITGMRSQTVAAIRLRPVTYEPATGGLRVYRRIAVVARIVGGERAVGAPPADPGFEPLYRSVLLNAESARALRRPMAERLGRQRAVATAAGVGFDVAPRWVKVQVDGKGIQRITGADLQSLGYPAGGIPPGQLRLFTRSGIPLLPEFSYCDTCGLDEVAVRVVDGGDGRFDAGDYLLFYGLPPSTWRDDFTGPLSADQAWLDHPYEAKNIYWLTWQADLPTSPRRWASRDVAPTRGDAVPAPYYSARLHFEQNAEYRPNMFEPGLFWDQWAWLEYTDRLGTQVWLGDAPGAVTDEPARLFARFWGQSQESRRSAGILDHYLDVTFNDVPLAQRAWNGKVRRDVDSTAVWIRESGNRLTARAVRVTDPLNSGRYDRQSILYWELYFKRRFRAVGDVAQFATPQGVTGNVGYGVAPFSASAVQFLLLLDVSDPISPVELTGWYAADTSGGKALYLHDAAEPARSYFAGPAGAHRRPVLTNADVRDPRGSGLGADYLVIAFDEFEPQAADLAALRRRVLPGMPGASAAVVRMSDILAWYSGGRMDPTAVRNFLYDVSTGGRWAPVPTYVCFFGDASYDFKNILRYAPAGRPAALVPSYVHGYFAGQFMTDDWLADMDLGPKDPPLPGVVITPDDIPDFVIGRLPAATAAEAAALVSGKIAPYDERPEFGEWRDRALLVADDFYQGFQEDGTPRPDGLWGVHMYQSEAVDGALPPEVDRAKVYLARYPFGVGAEKPGANSDTKKWLNQGCLMWNFVGHGNPFKMADENAFIISDVAALTNIDRLSFLIAASCDVGKFDDPIVQGLGEALLKSPIGGCVATFSSSDIAFSSQNNSLNIGILQQIFAPSAEGYQLTLGQASYLVKRRSDASANDRKYTLQGDPGTRLASARLDVRLALFDDETGATLGDSLPAGRRVRVEGEVHGTHDTTTTALRADFNGTASLLVTDSAPTDTFRLFPSSSVLEQYTYDPGAVFRGDVPVVGGKLTARFYVPLEALRGPRGRARVYVRSDVTDGVGARNQQVVDGVPGEVDTTGPSIHLQFVDAGHSAVGGPVVGPGAELRIVLEDEHGIDITGHSSPNAITLAFDDGSRLDLTDQFRYDASSYTRGTLVYGLPALASGIHAVEVSAADNFAFGPLGRKNRSRASLDFTVLGAGYTAPVQVMNFPNPFEPGRGTQLIVSGLTAASEVEVRVFAVDGRLVRSLRGAGGPGQAQVGWDGRDEAGAEVANGVYLYRVSVFPAGGAVLELQGRAAAVR